VNFLILTDFGKGVPNQEAVPLLFTGSIKHLFFYQCWY
jgi:hypothetical protein